MMPFYRNEDGKGATHFKMSARHAPKSCGAPFELDVRQRCGRIATKLCDWPVGAHRTCDLPICDRHAKEVGPDRHYCPRHAAGLEGERPKLSVVGETE